MLKIILKMGTSILIFSVLILIAMEYAEITKDSLQYSAIVAFITASIGSLIVLFSGKIIDDYDRIDDKNNMWYMGGLVTVIFVSAIIYMIYNNHVSTRVKLVFISIMLVFNLIGLFPLFNSYLKKLSK